MDTKKNVITKEEMKDVTKERIKYVAKMYRDSIDKIFTDGKTYLVKFSNGYSVDSKKEVEAKNITKICYYSWLATDQKMKKEDGAKAKA